MAKILRFKSEKDNLKEYLDGFVKYFKKNKIDNIMVCGKNKNTKEVVTGYFNLDNFEKQELVGHIQLDIVDQMIKNNINDYIEFIEY